MVSIRWIILDIMRFGYCILYFKPWIINIQALNDNVQKKHNCCVYPNNHVTRLYDDCWHQNETQKYKNKVFCQHTVAINVLLVTQAQKQHLHTQKTYKTKLEYVSCVVIWIFVMMILVMIQWWALNFCRVVAQCRHLILFYCVQKIELKTWLSFLRGISTYTEFFFAES